MTKRTKLAGQHISLDMQVSAIPGSVTRRQFLQALVAAGASVALPMPLAAASVEAIDAAWQQAVERPWYFEVNEWGTIVEPGMPEPRVRSDVFEVWDLQPRNPEHLIGQVEGIWPLQAKLQSLAEERCVEIEAEIERLGVGAVRRGELETLLEGLSDPEYGWKALVHQDGCAGIDGYWTIVEQWLAEPIDWSESDWFPMDWHGTGRAYQFFRGMESALLEALGVEIVEGACPGSDYFAAELHLPIEEASAHAAERGLPFRFRPEEVQS